MFTGLSVPADYTPAKLISERLQNAMEQHWHKAAMRMGESVLREMGLTTEGVPTIFRLALGCRELTKRNRRLHATGRAGRHYR